MNGTIRIAGAHDHGDGHPEIVKTECKATCKLNEGIYTITYVDEDNITHFLEIGEGTINMKQTGQVTSDMRFKLGEVWSTPYSTPFGIMNMTVITKNLMIELSNKRIAAHVHYELQMDGDKISDSKVRISYNFEV
ncbi:MAG: DUF1934 domain-containing protein [Butyrivibrio sp.]|nr:DUF1934 domain-containing protein [Butyrivibrio sp.]